VALRSIELYVGLLGLGDGLRFKVYTGFVEL
jgi:hypothetical protein